MESVNVKIDDGIVERIVQAEIQAHVAAALGKYSDLIPGIVSAALSYQVNSEGERSRYDSDNKYTYLEAFVKKSIQEAAKEAFREHMAEIKPKLKAALRAELKKAARADQFAALITDQLATGITSNWRISTEIKLPGQD